MAPFFVHDVLASPVIIGPVVMLGFLESGGTDEGQAIAITIHDPSSESVVAKA